MRELEVAQKQVKDQKGRVHTYAYSILVGEMPVAQGFSCESYGVCIREQDGEDSTVPNITPSISRIDALMDRLVRNSVTPCTLRDVVEDWL